ncbi:group II intron maturase-specific domain-containing protein [Natranaerovirga hydrolytica]|uniref:group II intron maturase-specific domain-containing protein n=1 Tax=Natranaerovirga hydrolytica TaxID=680378 RepID=UPI001FA9714A|nr:group II intron maturase-specific domain-containing protein [Natranaerovirga hydrolytica]
MKTLGKRLRKFGLTLAEEKTKMIRFSRFEKEKNGTFDFLGFTYRWEKSRKGKDIITHKTSKKGFKKTIQKFKEWIRENRHCRLIKMFKELNTKLRGYYNYYGTIGNSKKITQVYRIVIKTLYKWLNRRSQRKSFIWEEFGGVIKRYKLLKPYIASKYQQMTIKTSC